jgi:hypothetical protein
MVDGCRCLGGGLPRWGQLQQLGTSSTREWLWRVLDKLSSCVPAVCGSGFGAVVSPLLD